MNGGTQNDGWGTRLPASSSCGRCGCFVCLIDRLNGGPHCAGLALWDLTGLAVPASNCADRAVMWSFSCCI